MGWTLAAALTAVPRWSRMPIVPAGADVDFLRRQVLMSRNIRGNGVVDFVMGGLNRQNVTPREAQYSRTRGWTLNDVEHRARDPFSCPLAAQLGR